MLGRRECGGGVVERNLLEQDPLVERLQVGRAGFVAEGIGEAADLLTLSRVVGAVGKGSEQGDGEDGVLLFGSHLLSWSRYGIAGLSSSRARKRFMRIVRRPAEPVMNGRAFGRPRRIVAVRANPSLLPAGAGSILSAARGSETACALHPSTTLDVAVGGRGRGAAQAREASRSHARTMPSQGPAADPEARDSHVSWRSCCVATKTLTSAFRSV